MELSNESRDSSRLPGRVHYLQLRECDRNPLHPGGTFEVDVCSQCHPFYTGKQKQAESGGQVDKFKQRFGVISSGKKK